MTRARLPVVGPQVKSDSPIRTLDEASGNGPLLASEVLVSAGRFKANFAALGRESQISLRIQGDLLRTAEFHRNLLRVRSRRYFKVVFQPSLVAVIRQINSRIDLLVAHACKLRHIAMPFRRIFPDKVVALARQ